MDKANGVDIHRGVVFSCDIYSKVDGTVGQYVRGNRHGKTNSTCSFLYVAAESN